MFPLSFVNYLELSALCISALAFPKFKGSSFRLFPFFLGFITLVGLTDRGLRLNLLQRQAWLFDLTATVEFIFYAYIFETHLRSPVFKKIASRFIAVYPVLVLLDALFIQGFDRLPSYTLILGSLFMIVLCCLFFYELLLHPLEGRLSRDPMFWISTGILFFYLGGLSYSLLYDLLEGYATGSGRIIFQAINNNLILLLYSCFIIAFLCKRTPRKSLLP